MNNTLMDLNNYLFEAIERLTDDNLTEQELDREIKRCTAVQHVASTIIMNANVVLNAKKHLDEYGAGDNIKLSMLETT